MEIERKIRKIGNSLGVNLPADMLKEVGVKEGDVIYISIENDSIVIRNEKMKADNDTLKKEVLKIVEEYMHGKNKNWLMITRLSDLVIFYVYICR